MNAQPHDPRQPADEPAQPLLGSAPTRRRSRFSGFTVNTERGWPVAVGIALLVLGSLVRYLSMPYITFSAEPAVFSASLWPAAQFIRGVDPLWLPGYEPGPATEQIIAALNVFNLGPSLQQIGAVVAVLTCVALFQDEINKFLWWPLHLSGWLLALSPAPLLIGLAMLRAAGVSLTLTWAWVPLALAGVVILVATFRAHRRLDTYAGV